ncbi:MAG: M20/M25/M40 family metallo-hydrolase [Cyclobacteriaceae bacterium]|nr:M20/M25/M40 family metallo-hydrolase [Cyclobacteriaceae bacterium]
MSAEDRKKLGNSPFSEKEFMESLDVDAVAGEAGYTVLEQLGIRPTLDCNGIWGGYTRRRSPKRYCHRKHMPKYPCVLYQIGIAKRWPFVFTDHFNAIAPHQVKVKVIPHHGGEPAVTPIDSVAFKAAEKAYLEGWGKMPIPTRDGGSIPIVALFKKELGLDTLLLGLGLDYDAIHSPNESFGVYNYLKGIETIVLFHKHFSLLNK